MRLGCLVGIAAIAACSKHPPAYVAELEQVAVTVERMPSPDAPWQAATVGDTFVLGSALRTGPVSHARLRIATGGRLEVDASAIVHFTRHPTRARDVVRVETGTVELEAGDEMLGFGDAVLEPHGRAQLTQGKDGLTIAVSLGRVLLENEPTASTIEAGHSLTLAATKPRTTPADAASRDGAVAITVTGKPATMQTGAGSTPLPAGNHEAPSGAQITVPAGSSIEVGSADARAVVPGPAALHIGNGVLATITSGAFVLHGVTADAVVDVPGGTITARPGGDTMAQIATTGTVVIADRGETRVRTPKTEQILQTGDSMTLAADGTIEPRAIAPKRATMSIVAGESPSLHDPQAPTAVGVSFGTACPGSGTVELARDRSFRHVLVRAGGTARANVLLAPGAYNYRVRCDAGGAGASGTIKLDRGSGRAPLPKATARTVVEADGREYVILYQNRLPELTLSWRNAPARPSYTFVIQPARGAAKRLPSKTAKLALPSGQLAEGSYRFWIETPEASRSEEAKIVIEFDNAAASASIEAVEHKADKLVVRGTVIDGSVVSASGAAVELDRHHRFTAEVGPVDGEDGVAVRIAHPKLGLDYYVVR